MTRKKKQPKKNDLKMLQGSNINIYVKKNRKNRVEIHTKRDKPSKEKFKRRCSVI